MGDEGAISGCRVVVEGEATLIVPPGTRLSDVEKFVGKCIVLALLWVCPIAFMAPIIYFPLRYAAGGPELHAAGVVALLTLGVGIALSRWLWAVVGRNQSELVRVSRLPLVLEAGGRLLYDGRELLGGGDAVQVMLDRERATEYEDLVFRYEVYVVVRTGAAVRISPHLTGDRSQKGAEWLAAFLAEFLNVEVVHKSDSRGNFAVRYAKQRRVK